MADIVMELDDILEMDVSVRDWNPNTVSVKNNAGDFNLNGVETKTGIFDPKSTGIYNIEINDTVYTVDVVNVSSSLLSEDLIAWSRFNDRDTRDYASYSELPQVSWADSNAYDGFNVDGVTFNRDGSQDGTTSAVFTGSENNGDRFLINSSVLYDKPNYSVSLWIKVNKITQNRIVNFGNKNANEGGMITGIRNDGDTRLYNDEGGGSWDQLKGGDFNTGEWEHLVHTYDGSRIRGYQNGSSIGSLTRGYDSSPETASISIGDKLDSKTEAFIGEINDLRFYNKALSSGEVSDIYESTR